MLKAINLHKKVAVSLSLILYVFLFKTLFISGTFSAHASNLSVGIDSQYITEGREQLSGGAISWVGASHPINQTTSLSLSYGYALKSGVNYDELDITFEYADAYLGFEYAFALTRLEFLKDDLHDNELAISLIYSDSKLFKPFVNLIYGQESNGFFVDIGLTTEFEIFQNFTLAPQILVAYDYGYAQGLRDGFSHSAVRGDFSYQFKPNIAITGVIEKTYGGSILKEEFQNAEQLWGGIHLVFNW